MHRWFTAEAWQRKSPKVTVDLPQSKMRPGSLTEVGRDYFWSLTSIIELLGEVMTKAGQMAVNHLGTLHQD